MNRCNRVCARGYFAFQNKQFLPIEMVYAVNQDVVYVNIGVDELLLLPELRNLNRCQP